MLANSLFSWSEPAPGPFWTIPRHQREAVARLAQAHGVSYLILTLFVSFGTRMLTPYLLVGRCPRSGPDHPVPAPEPPCPDPRPPCMLSLLVISGVNCILIGIHVEPGNIEGGQPPDQEGG